ncbi:TPA: ribose-5-phosphate isomerase, partial [Enterococcus faecium]|nr:ribose-5-phosphate isomerase [Enterococcus faecium]HCI1380240.1 ribose-5-phosphate isomerase [Enterococcus faecium]
YFLDKIKDAVYHEDEIKVIELAGLVEISIPKHELGATLAV